MITTIRKPAVAGQFYSGDAADLSANVQNFLQQAPATASVPAAVIAPHAGYTYCGPLMAASIGATREAKPDVIVILSPSHRDRFAGLALSSAGAFAFPGGESVVHQRLGELLLSQQLAHVRDTAHDKEHGVEVMLPMIHMVHPGIPILPIVIGSGSEDLLPHAIDKIAQAATAPLFVLSSDLSHYLALPDAQKRDAQTAKRIELGDTTLTGADACGAAAINGYLRSNAAASIRVLRLGMRNSATTSGDQDCTVGYGAWAFIPPAQAIFDNNSRAQMLRVTRQVLASRLTKDKAPFIDTPTFPAPLCTHAACFVTLEQAGRLRGCIGSLRAHRPLIEDLANNAQKAALEDPRFKPMELGELENTAIKIAVLTAAHDVAFADQASLEAQLVPHRDGLILRDNGKSGVFLPMVWDKLPGPHDFVNALKVKAGLPHDYWSDTLKISRFYTESFTDAHSPI